MGYDYKLNEEYKKKESIIELLEILPRFCTDYVVFLEHTVSSATIYAYLLRIKKFLEYERDTQERLKNKEISNFTFHDIAHLEPDDIKKFADYIQYNSQSSEGRAGINKNITVNNYLSALSSLWDYFIMQRYVKFNPIMSVKRNKITKGERTSLNKANKKLLYNALYKDYGFTERQKEYNQRTKERDVAILRILIDTDIQVSELVGLDVDDLDFQSNSLKIIRNNAVTPISIDNEIKQCLEDYLEQRISYYQPVTSEQALFLVGIGTHKGERLSVRSVEKIVKKYLQASVFNAV